MFLTLTEPPGTLKNLIGFNDSNTIDDKNESTEEEFDIDSHVEDDFPCEPVDPNCIDVAIIANTSPTDLDSLSRQWKYNFSRRPTWYDAGMALHQIIRGKAVGFRAPLYSRIFIQHSLFRAGCFVQRRAWFIIVTLMTLFSFCCFGLRYVNVETDIVKLWVSEGGRLNEELKFLTTLQNRSRDTYILDESYLLRNFERDNSDPRLGLIPEDDAPMASYQVLIQTADPKSREHNVLSRIDLLKHVNLLKEITQMRIFKFGRHWRLEDICFKPGSLDISNSSIAHALKPTLERLVPCVWISPIDCFFEGAKPLGPSPPIKLKNIPFGPLLNMLLSDMPDEATWANLNPEQIIQQVAGTFDLGTINNFFLRSGIGTGYLQRTCIDPLDPDCPKTAPNFYNSCEAISHLEQSLLNQNSTLSEFLSPFTTAKDSEMNLHQPTSALDILGALFFNQRLNENKTEKGLSSRSTCDKYRTPFLRWMASEWDKAKQQFPSNFLPTSPNYGLLMKNGCNGIAKNVMNWPAEMILGGIRQIGNKVEADALQSVILVATPTDVFRRFKDSNIFSGINSTLSSKDWSPLTARDIIQDWARAFTDKIYNHDLNKNGHRVVHSLASNSISDMLAEFCDFNYAIILVGYLLMLVYALYSQCRFDGCCSLGVESAVGLALAGVLTVTLSSVAGLGVSILISSLNNIFAFCAGTILPIPALRSFCAQTAILLSVNLVGIFLIYPAFIALDLKRRKAGRRDLAFLAYYCLCMDESVGTVQHYQHQNNDNNGVTHQELINAKSDYECASPPYLPAELDKTVNSCKHPEVVYTQPKLNNVHQFERTRKRRQKKSYRMYTLQGFLHIVYIPLLKYTTFKIGVLLSAFGLFLLSLYGISHSTIGLELSDILPENSAPADFLKTRDRYFSFYPMSIVLHGEQIDFPARQHQIDLLRNEIGYSRFVVKLADGEPSERYWLQLFRDWLIGMQQRLDNAKIQFGDLNSANLTSSMIGNPDLQIAFSLACSYGENYDCDRVNFVRLIDESGTINSDGFYNYLYGWHEYEQMFYAVSQASFYPRLKKLRQGTPGNMKYRYFIPPAPKPLFSRIPFYLSGLHDTPTIMQMIHDIRSISENYTRMGLGAISPPGILFSCFYCYNLALSVLRYNVCFNFNYYSLLFFSLIIFNPWAAGIVTLVVLSMTVELAGFMGLAHVKLNPISAVTLITAVGIGVEFTAHVVLAFLTSLGTRHERMEECLKHMFVPVIHGGMSTLLGIVMLAFSQFDFVFKYFFVVMTALVIIGMLNGLALLPVLLSIIGPPCEIKPVGDGAVNRLRCLSVNDKPRLKQLTTTKFYLPSNLSTFHH
uniref:SSD domain-containing protein n=2 Tax=Meloidogyne TaxID=189290 RepID=A0A915NM73_9BILA